MAGGSVGHPVSLARLEERRPQVITHVKESELRWQVIVEFRNVAIECWIPRTATMADVAGFCDSVKDSMRRRFAARKGANHGETQGQGKGEVSGQDEAGQGKAKGQPTSGGKKGGPDAA
jgi:hypothetical protein